MRAIAVLAVIFYHYRIPPFTGGFAGVDVFFVISGYVIAGSIAGDIRSGDFTLANFYFKRIRRIFPALAAMVLATTVAAAIVFLPQDLADYSRSVAWTSAFASNVFFWRDSGYFAPEAQLKPLLHTWSLAVEEQYYLFAPLLFWAIHRFGQRRWLLFLAPLMLVSFALCVATVFVGPKAGFFLLPPRMWELLLGAALALTAWTAPSSRALREAMGALGLGLIALGVFTLTDDDPFPGWNALMPCLGAALVIWSGTGAHGAPLVGRLLSTTPLVGVGALSYSLYLAHWPIAAFARYLALRGPTLPEAAAMIALSFVLAWLSWRFVEQPIRHLGLAHRRGVLLGGAAMVAGGLLLGAAGVASKGLPGRYPDLVERTIPGEEAWGGPECFNLDDGKPHPWDAAACTRIHGAHGRILLWGDSFAAQYTPGILGDARRIDADVLEYTFTGCPPLLDFFSYAHPGCAAHNQAVPGIIRAQHIDTVVMAARWTEPPRAKVDRLGRTVAALRALGVKVYVIGQSPQFATDVQHLDYISGSRLRPGVAYWPPSFDPGLNRHLASLAAGATFIDPLPAFCRPTGCAYRDGNAFYFIDFGHFSAAGSLRAVKAYFPAGR